MFLPRISLPRGLQLRRQPQPPPNTCPSLRTAPVAAVPVNQQDTISQQDKDKLELMQQRFTLFDRNQSGEIGRDALRQLLQSVQPGAAVPQSLHSQHWLPDAELDHVMETYDKDGSGTINFQEYTSIVTDGLLLEGTLQEYEDAFRAVDKSGNGTIGAMELHQLFQNLGQDMSFEKLSSIMEKYDKDESGQIEFNEFLLMFRDQLLDLKDMEMYLSSASDCSAPAKSQEILDIEEGGVSLIFSEQELDTVMQREDKLVLVYTALTWCRPCKAMVKPLSRLAQHYRDSFIMVKLFGNSNEQTKRLFKDVLKVRSTPCFMIFKGQQLLHTQLGPNKEKLEDALRALVLEGKMPQGRLYFPQT